jgi:hypothetical protein
MPNKTFSVWFKAHPTTANVIQATTPEEAKLKFATLKRKHPELHIPHISAKELFTDEIL